MSVHFSIGAVSTLNNNGPLQRARLDEAEVRFILQSLRAVRAVENMPHNVRAIDKLTDVLEQAVE